MNQILEIFTDGACSGNPGQAGIGVVLKQQGKVVGEISQGIGQATNNIAEYMAVIYGLQEALIQRFQDVTVYTDSELLCNQFNRIYKVKNENLKPLFDQIQHLMRGFHQVKVRHIPRNQNKDADHLAKKAVKSEQAKMVASLFD